jgi:hypothetical protein
MTNYSNQQHGANGLVLELEVGGRKEVRKESIDGTSRYLFLKMQKRKLVGSQAEMYSTSHACVSCMRS